jgi:DinB superfamily
MRLPEATSMLARTPKVLRTLLAGLPEDWLHRNDGPGTWSAYDIAGHLLNGDFDNWLPRLTMIFEHGTGKTFVPFDRVAMLGWERLPVEELLERFALARQASLEGLGKLDLTGKDLHKRGVHPEFGEVTAAQVLSTWVAHDLTHLAQIGEVLARRYREDVGPYRAYLPALERTAEAE